jgi:MFS family permease
LASRRRDQHDHDRALAIALTAPFTGVIADVLGRKRVIAAAMLAVVVCSAISSAGAPLSWHSVYCWSAQSWSLLLSREKGVVRSPGLFASARVLPPQPASSVSSKSLYESAHGSFPAG